MAEMAVTVTELDPDAVWDSVATRRHDVVVAVADSADDQLVRAMQAVAPGGRMFLLISRSAAGSALRKLALHGLSIEFEYWIASSVTRPTHAVPEDLRALYAHLDVVQARGGVVCLIRKVALKLGWRPLHFGARFLIAGRS